MHLFHEIITDSIILSPTTPSCLGKHCLVVRRHLLNGFVSITVLTSQPDFGTWEGNCDLCSSWAVSSLGAGPPTTRPVCSGVPLWPPHSHRPCSLWCSHTDCLSGALMCQGPALLHTQDLCTICSFGREVSFTLPVSLHSWWISDPGSSVTSSRNFLWSPSLVQMSWL